MLFLEANHAGKQMYTTQFVTCFRIQTNHAALHVEQLYVIEESLIYSAMSTNTAVYHRYYKQTTHTHTHTHKYTRTHTHAHTRVQDKHKLSITSFMHAMFMQDQKAQRVKKWTRQPPNM